MRRSVEEQINKVSLNIFSSLIDVEDLLNIYALDIQEKYGDAFLVFFEKSYQSIKDIHDVIKQIL